jgi:aryl-alcohol dehydrogenase-like predicted oxidoreductase
VHGNERENLQRLGGSAYAALSELFRSPYLLSIAAWISLQSFCATMLYFEQIHLVAAEVQGAGAQTRIFASMDLAVNLLTLATQIFATGHLLKRFATGPTAATLPLVYLVGFLAIFAAPAVQPLVANGGRLIDTASSYGNAESVLGDVIAAGRLRDNLFISTKLEKPGGEEFNRSLTRLKTTNVDLLQRHNVHGSQQSKGVCRYVGVTSTSHDDFTAVEAVLGRERPDFVQIDYSLDDREAKKRILLLASEVESGVLTHLPFGRGRLFRAVRGKTIPDWARGFADSWAESFLKYLLGDPRVTAVVPGTGDPTYMLDNLHALRGDLPNPEQRQRIVTFLEAL